MPLTCLLKQLVHLTDYLRSYIYERTNRRKLAIKEALTKKINNITKVVKVVFDEIMFDKDLVEIYNMLQMEHRLSAFKTHEVIDLAVAASAAVETGGAL
jgi:hypothetical protein